MGLPIDRESFGKRDYERFARRLEANLEVLRRLLSRPGFGVGETTIGAELELALIGPDARPLPINLAVIGETLDPRITVELNRYNLECNLRHTPIAGRPFDFLRREMADALGELGRAAALHGARVIAVGILPTLMEADLQSHAMTNTARFRALSASLQRRRSGPFEFRIDGAEPLTVSCDDVTFEGAATSLQLHLRVDPARFADLFNAAQLATAPALAVSGNSPNFLGHSLWRETRVALFKQAVDDRDPLARGRSREARVSFGRGWIEHGALEVFSDAVHTHEALLPILGPEDPFECLEAGGTPALDEIRLHQGTVWSWNRPVYDPAAGGHLRIELRALPAGPTIVDMMANAAFLIGLSLGLAGEMRARLETFPFESAHRNFYRAAKWGLDSMLSWPASDARDGAVEVVARDLVASLLPVAERGLRDAGVDSVEIGEHLSVIRARCESGQTGAQWQTAAIRQLDQQMDRVSALALVVERYFELSNSGLPVHCWEPGVPVTAR